MIVVIIEITIFRNGLSVDQSKISFAEMMEDDAQTSREERCFRLWINSLGVETHVNNLFDDVREGWGFLIFDWHLALWVYFTSSYPACRWVLLEVLAKAAPGSVNWKQSSKPPIKMPFKKLENCNQVVSIGKELNFSLVNIAGNDIVQGNKKLILGKTAQLCISWLKV